MLSGSRPFVDLYRYLIGVYRNDCITYSCSTSYKKITHVRYNKTATSKKMSSPKLNFADGQYSIELKHWK